MDTDSQFFYEISRTQMVPDLHNTHKRELETLTFKAKDVRLIKSLSLGSTIHEKF